MRRPGPYYVLIRENEEQHASLFQFDSLMSLREWQSVKDDEPPTRYSAKFLGTVFEPKDLTPSVIESLQGFENLFAEFEELRERRQRANKRRQGFKNRPNRR